MEFIKMGSMFVRLCGAQLRGKPGQTCRAPALKNSPHGRCRLHQGRPRSVGSPEGIAATRAGHAAHYAKRRAAKARGEPVRPSGGRSKKWLIPRHWRLQLSPEDEARVLAHMVDYEIRVRGGKPRPPWSPITSQRVEARALESFARTWVLRLNDPVVPLSREQMEQAYASIRAAEEILGFPGADVRLTRLAWEREQFYLRALNSSVVARALKPQPGAVKPEPPPRPSSHATARLNLPADDGSSPLESEAELAAEAAFLESHIPSLRLSESSRQLLMSELERARDAASRCRVLESWFASTQRAYAANEGLIGQHVRAVEARAASPPPQSGPHSIAPWLRRL
jgi:hypothetical protein